MSETKRDSAQLDEADLEAIVGGTGSRIHLGEQLKGIPFNSLIGGPLKAATETQKPAGKSADDLLKTLGQQP